MHIQTHTHFHIVITTHNDPHLHIDTCTRSHGNSETHAHIDTYTLSHGNSDTHAYTDAYTRSHTGWRRLIGSLKLQIIFHKRATKYRSLLRKMTYKDKGSYESSPPCTHFRIVIMLDNGSHLHKATYVLSNGNSETHAHIDTYTRSHGNSETRANIDTYTQTHGHIYTFTWKERNTCIHRRIHTFTWK